MQNPWDTSLQQMVTKAVQKPVVVPPPKEQVQAAPTVTKPYTYKRQPTATPVATSAPGQLTPEQIAENAAIQQRATENAGKVYASGGNFITPSEYSKMDIATPTDVTTYPREKTLAETYYGDTATQTIDEASVRQQEMDKIQQQINAINAVYASELARAQTEGQRAIQQQQAISTVRGGAGSDFARAEQSNVESANQQVYNAIEAERAAKVTDLMTKGQANAEAKIASLKAERESARQTMLAGQKEKTSQLETYAQNLATAGVTWDNLDETTKTLLRQEYGTEGNAKSVYESLKPSIAEITAEPITKLIGKTLYQYNPDTGKWDVAISTPTVISGAITGGASGEYTPGVNPTVDNWVKAINSGTAKLTNVPANLKNSVVNALSTVEPESKASELKTSALSSAQELLRKMQSGEGTSAVGKSRVFGVQYLPGTAAKNFQIQFNNLKSLLSLENVKYLKGQGQVSDAERRLLAEAAAKLELSQSEGEFTKALQDVITSLSGGKPNTEGTTSSGVKYKITQ